MQVLLILSVLVLLSPILIECESPIVKTKLGPIIGKQVLFNATNSVDSFIGIPYAKPPINELRFAIPQPIQPWNATNNETAWNATFARNSCIQQREEYANVSGPLSEDCLFLNVWRPSTQLNCSRNSNSCLRTVMFWIHGGGFTGRSIFTDIFDGRALVTIADVVLVTANYRLGAFSFMSANSSDTPGNLAFFDQLLALQWVNENIINFGGDPNSVTIFGQSAGAYSVGALIISPYVLSLNKKLFNRAILQSMSPFTYLSAGYPTVVDYQIMTKTVANVLGCKTRTWLECLRRVDPFVLLNATTNMFWMPNQGDGNKFLGVKTSVALSSGQFLKNIDVMIGSTRDEGSSFVADFTAEGFQLMLSDSFNKSSADMLMNELIAYPEMNKTEIVAYYMSTIMNSSSIYDLRKATYDLLGDYYITCPTYYFGKTFAAQSLNSKVYGYLLTKRPAIPVLPVCKSANWMGVCHSDDIAYVFGLPLRYPERYSSDDYDISILMIKMFAAFAKYGDPNIEEIREKWPQFRADTVVTARARNNTISVINPRFKEMNLYMNNTFNNLYANNCDIVWAKYINPPNNSSVKQLSSFCIVLFVFIYVKLMLNC